ncbi:MAG: tannase/feruloyl esterase family alpha/beta hydrolase [Mycobacterium sp.]|nr:tannase/feruloyl esterase family alpha/beta hydrolase [Mycobacterium sp.]
MFATDAVYNESSWSFTTTAQRNQSGGIERSGGGELIVYHGTADPIFSAADTTAMFEALQTANGGSSANFARYFMVPGMNHCSGGPATDQFDMLTNLVNWVEKGQCP